MNRITHSTRWLLTVTLIATFSLGTGPGCKGGKEESGADYSTEGRLTRVQSKAQEDPMEDAEEEWEMEAMEGDESGGTGTAMALDEGRMGKMADKKRASGQYAMKNESMARQSAKISGGLDDLAKGGPGGGGGERGVQTRSWFPETFLFEPRLITDEQGAGTLDVRVPDRLTTWRVLALAHSRQGGQAGATTSFLGTLPAYVDPVVPSLLRAGDRVRLPLQLVNTTADPIDSTLALEAVNATVTGGDGPQTIPARSNIVRYTELATGKPGEVRIMARMGDTDAVVRTIDVIPTGKPVTRTESGTLAEPRQFRITGPDDADPGLGSVSLQVFPGALAILRSELSASISRGGLADDAFALLLAGTAPALLRSLGDEPDPDALRTLTILATQRVIRNVRTIDTVRASLIADAALAHPDNPVLHRLGERAVHYLERTQLPDGTCSGQDGWPLQRLLVATADCARAAASKPTVGIRASGAFERHAKLIEDPYTAAAILASGAVSGKLAGALRKIILEAVVPRTDGARLIKVPAGVVRADGIRPSQIEATALAILALEGDAQAPLSDLGAAVLAGYSPSYGWGDGRANLVCMQAVLRLFKDPVPDNVTITLSMDGQKVAEGALTRDRIREVVTLEARGIDASGAHDWQVRAEPDIPGLGFALTLTNYVPWPTQKVAQGLELTVTPPTASAVGKPADVAVSANAPPGAPLTVELTWPAGVQVDTAALDRMVADDIIERYNAVDGKLELFIAGLSPAAVFSANIRTIPTLAGTLSSGPSAIKFGTTEIHQPPATWTVTP